MLFGVTGSIETVGDLLENIAPLAYRNSLADEEKAFRPVVENILREGSLAERMLVQYRNHPSLSSLCSRLRDCLNQGRLFPG
jgi:hypothetical protein